MTKQVVSGQGHCGVLELIFLGRGGWGLAGPIWASMLWLLLPRSHFNLPLSHSFHRKPLNPLHEFLHPCCYMCWELIWPLRMSP